MDELATASGMPRCHRSLSCLRVIKELDWLWIDLEKLFTYVALW